MPYEEYRLVGGLNLKSAEDVIGDGELRTAQDCEFDEIGTVSSRSSRTLLSIIGAAISGAGDAVLGGTRFRIATAADNLYANGGLIGAFTGSGQLSVIGYNDYAYIANGTTIKRYSVTKGIEAVGYSTPTTALAGAVTSGVDGAFPATADGITYKWVYTFFNGVAESNFSPVFTQIFDTDSGHHATINKMTLTVPVGPAGTTARRIYRTDKNGQWFFRVGELNDNSTTSFVDLGGLPAEADPTAVSGDAVSNVKRDNPDLEQSPGKATLFSLSGRGATDYQTAQVNTEVVMTNLGVMADWNDHDPPPAGIRNLKFLTERIYGIVGNALRWTLVSAPEHWSEYNEWLIGRQTGETLQTIEPLGGDVICYTDTAIWRFANHGLEPYQATLERVQSPVGVVSTAAVADLAVGGGRPAGHVFVATDGVYVFDGRQAVRISDKVEDLFRASSTSPDRFSLGAMSSVVVASKNDKVLISYATGSAGNDRTLLVDFEQPGDPKFAVWKVGYTSLHRDTDGKIIGGDAAGNLYELFTSGAEITQWDVRTKRFPISGLTALEKMERVVIDADLAGLDTTVTVSVNRNGGQSESAQFVITGSTGRTKFRRYLPFHLRGDAVSVAMSSTGLGRRRWHTVAFGFDQEAVE